MYFPLTYVFLAPGLAHGVSLLRPLSSVFSEGVTVSKFLEGSTAPHPYLPSLVTTSFLSCLNAPHKKTLICSKLFQQFCGLSIKPPISSNPFPFSIISLFDGSGSFTDVIANALNQWQHAILAAEMDAGTRSVVSRVKGWPAQGSIWAFDKQGAHTFYAKDVWDLIKDSCLLLRQFLSLLPPDCIIFVGAGSPCQDLTSIGRGKGVLGLAGDRSVHIHCVWAVLYFLSLAQDTKWGRCTLPSCSGRAFRPIMGCKRPFLICSRKQCKNSRSLTLQEWQRLPKRWQEFWPCTWHGVPFRNRPKRPVQFLGKACKRRR